MGERYGDTQLKTPEYIFEPERCVLHIAATYDPSTEALQELEARLPQPGTAESIGYPSAAEVAVVIANRVADEITAAGIWSVSSPVNKDGVWQRQPELDEYLAQLAEMYGEVGGQLVDLAAFNQWVHQISLGDILARVKQRSEFMRQQLPQMTNPRRGEDPSYDIDMLDASLHDEELDIASRDRVREHFASTGVVVRLPDGGVEVMGLMYWLEHTIECPSQPLWVQQSALRLRATLHELYGGSLSDPLLPQVEP